MKLHAIIVKKSFECSRCKCKFTSIRALKQHYERCGKGGHNCSKCNASFDTNRDRAQHEDQCTGASTSRARNGVSFKCRTCSNSFPSRKDLFRHQSRQHGAGADSLQPMPWNDQDAPWVENGEVNEQLRDAYEDNRELIREHSRVDSLPRVYNFPVSNNIDTDAIIDQIHSIVDLEESGFKINLIFRFLLYNRATGAYRYFRPNPQQGLLDAPFRINTHDDVEALRYFFERMDVISELMKQREKTKYILKLVTNVQMLVYPLDFKIGRGTLPLYIRQNRSIVSLDLDRQGNVFKDNLCAFRCLAYA